MFTRSTWIVGAITGGLRQLMYTSAYGQNQLTGNQYAAQTAHNVTETFGMMAGFEYGAILGSSIFPGVGTIAGTILGAVVGEKLGNIIGGKVGNILLDQQQSPKLLPIPQQ